MPDIHVPKLEGHGGGKSIFKLVLEVALIGVGVFLGLAGEQWRERARHHELAEQALRRFRTEITANRKAVADVKDYHVERLKELNAYFDAPLNKRNIDQIHITHGIAAAAIEHTAWDLALATQALGDIDSDLAFAISAAYNVQERLTAEGLGFLQGMFARPPAESLLPYLAGLQAYCSDAIVYEPRLLMMYDDLLPRIDKALGDQPAGK